MPALAAFDYAVVRVVPRVEREEFINVGAVLFCPDRGWICARIELDEPRLLALFPGADLALIREHLEAFRRTCAGGEGAGPIGLLPARERWHWLVAPKNTIIQTSAPHGGLCDDPEQALERILDANVRPPRAEPASP